MKILVTLFLMVFSGLFIQAQEDIMLLKPDGKVVIGNPANLNTTGNYSLFVEKGVLTERVKVALRNTTAWSDDAWDKTPSILLVEQTINEKKHLPSMPSAQELVKNEGYDVLTMDAKLLEQVEWLWQHMIELKKENEELKKEIAEIKKSK